MLRSWQPSLQVILRASWLAIIAVPIQLMAENPDHVWHAMIAVGRNFGVGSSREAAVFGPISFGIRSVIAPKIGDIFQQFTQKRFAVGT